MNPPPFSAIIADHHHPLLKCSWPTAVPAGPCCTGFFVVVGGWSGNSCPYLCSRRWLHCTYSESLQWHGSLGATWTKHTFIHWAQSSPDVFPTEHKPSWRIASITSMWTFSTGRRNQMHSVTDFTSLCWGSTSILYRCWTIVKGGKGESDLYMLRTVLFRWLKWFSFALFCLFSGCWSIRSCVVSWWVSYIKDNKYVIDSMCPFLILRGSETGQD
jgi:hypothetical protein